MLSKEELQKKLLHYFVENFPEEADAYDVRLISAEAIDPESETIKRIVLDFQLAFNSEKYDSCSNLFMACEELATNFRETELVERLNQIWDGRATGLAIAYNEFLILKSIKQGGKEAYEVEDEIYTVGRLNFMLKNNKRQIYKIFGEIQRSYNFKPADFDWSKQVTNKDANIGFDDLKI